MNYTSLPARLGPTLTLWAVLGLVARLPAAIPPVAKLLPQDTMAFVTVPDWVESSAKTRQTSLGQLWNDTAMKPFRDHFELKFQEQVLGKLEQDLGIKTADYLPLLQGQLTLAAIADEWDGTSKNGPDWVLILDAKEKSGELKVRLEEVRKKLAENGKSPKTEKIRDLQFTSVTIEPKPVEKKKAASKDKDADDDDVDVPAPTPSKQTYVFGQVDSALLVANSTKPLEKLVARMTGGSVSALGEEPTFSQSEPRFREASAFGWLNWSLLGKGIIKALAENEQLEGIGVDPKEMFKATGLKALRTVDFALYTEKEGLRGEFNLNLPESERVGLFKMLQFEAKDAGPLAFVPADAITFTRTRIDWRKFVGTLEEVFQGISPQLSGVFNMVVGAAGKDKDPNFDLRKQVFLNLGDDLMVYQRLGKNKTPEELANLPTLTLLSSPAADDLVSGIKAAGSLAPGGAGSVKEREVAGKKIQSLPFPQPGKPQGTLEYSASGGYVAFSTQPAMLEEYIRSADGSGKSLKDNPELSSAAEKIGGFGKGIFIYENQRETMRSNWGVLRGGGLDRSPMGRGELAELFDFKRLPEFGLVQKYFGISVFTGAIDAQGFHFRNYSPSPK